MFPSVEDALLGTGRSKSVSWKSPPGDTKESKVLCIEKAPGEEHCCVILLTSSGLPHFCAERVEQGGKGHCRFGSHITKVQATAVPYPALFVMDPVRGKGGDPYYATKFIKAEGVPQDSAALMKEAETTGVECDDHLRRKRVKAVVGTEGSTARQLQFNGRETLKVVYTPQRQRVKSENTGIGEDEIPLSPDATDSWQSVAQLTDAEPLEFKDISFVLSSPPADLSTSVAKKGKSTKKGLQDASTNFKDLKDHLKRQRSGVSADFRDIFGKLNTLSRAVDALDSRIGIRQGFGDKAGVSSTFEGLLYLQDAVAEVKSRLWSYGSVVTKVDDMTVIGEALDARTAKIKADTPRLATLNTKIKAIRNSITVSFHYLKEKFVRPMLQLHSRLTVNKDMSGADFLSRFALMETKVK
jgi:hypothetical protein